MVKIAAGSKIAVGNKIALGSKILLGSRIIFSSMIAAGAYILLENKYLEVTYNTVKSEKIPKAFDGFRAVCLTDFHGNSFGKNNIYLIKQIEKFMPDVVFISGDMIVGGKKSFNADTALNLLKTLSKKYIIFYGIGNHELKAYKRNTEQYLKYLEAVKSFGVIILDNDSADITINNEKINISGFSVPLKYYKKTEKQAANSTLENNIIQPLNYKLKNGVEQFVNNASKNNIKQSLNNTLKNNIRQSVNDTSKNSIKQSLSNKLKNSIKALDKNIYNIMLAHTPEFFKEYSEFGADLVLAGHVHGGIIRLPFIGGVISPNYKIFPKYDAGVFYNNNSCMLLSRGLGTHTIPVRIFNRPELMCITLKRIGADNGTKSKA